MTTRLLLLLLVLGVAACGGDSLAGFGETCRAADECADGVCALGSCTSACTGNAECASGATCGTLSDGRRVCLAGCTATGVTHEGFGCVDGAQVACERAGAAAPCSQCGCATGEYCPSDDTAVTTCQPLAAEGASCRSNPECASGNCSVHDSRGDQSGTCLKAAGSACTPGEASCPSCDVTTSGNQCAQSCGVADRCHGECIGTDQAGYFCRQSCAGSMRCPPYWTCEVLSVTRDIAYCAPPDRCDPSQTAPCGLLGTCHPELHICI